MPAEQVPLVRRMLDNYRHLKETLESISEINQQILREDRNEAAGEGGQQP